MIDYKKIGFKAGLEIHQQLSGRKLFCSCPAIIREDNPDIIVHRMLRPSFGESGIVDAAALAEFRKQKVFVYQGYNENTCLVELDEEPVLQPSSDAVETAVMVSRMLSMQLFSPVHVMRKVVVDGSNTSGFQRTMAIGFSGVITDSSGSVIRIDRLCLEEDSARIVSRTQESDTYNLSRLGIPLLEITTKPDIRSPNQLQEVAGQLGMILRSTGRIKRGLGTIRQDVNVSIAQGSRVEIKGVQDFDLLPTIAHNEALRQLGLVALAAEYSQHSFVLSSPVDVSQTFSSSSTKWISSTLQNGTALAVVVSGAQGFFGRELYPGFRVGSELSGYVQASGFGGIIHTDEKPQKYGLSSWDELFSRTQASSQDAILVLLGDAHRASETFTEVVSSRLQEFCLGVPSCVRKAQGDGTTTYLRPMPGSARMYPETDVRSFSVSSIHVDIPELLTVRAKRLSQEFSISEDVASLVCRSGRADIFEHWAKVLSASLVADVLVVKEKEIRRRHSLELDVNAISEELFSRLASGSLQSSAIEEVLVSFARDGIVLWESFASLSEQEVKNIVSRIVSENADAPFGALMGLCMKELSGRADGKMVSSLIKELT